MHKDLNLGIIIIRIIIIMIIITIRMIRIMPLFQDNNILVHVLNKDQ